LEKLLQRFAKEYLESIMQVQQTAGGKLSDEAVSNPEIASGLEKFRKTTEAKKDGVHHDAIRDHEGA